MTVSLSSPSIVVDKIVGTIQLCVEKNRLTTYDVTVSLTSQDKTATSNLGNDVCVCVRVCVCLQMCVADLEI